MDDPFLQSREWRTVRMRALERDGGKCACCGKTAADGIRLNVDHIKPRIRYPELALTVDNLQVLCEACNHGKGNRYETDWRGPPRIATQEQADAPPSRRAPSVERRIISYLLINPELALTDAFDAYAENDRTADGRALAWLVATIKDRRGLAITTPQLLQLGTEEFGDILVAALATAEDSGWDSYWVTTWDADLPGLVKRQRELVEKHRVDAILNRKVDDGPRA